MVTVLSSVPFTATPGHFCDVRFDVLRNELHAWVDGKLLAQAVDGDIAKGVYGLGSYRSAFTFKSFAAGQP